MSQLLDLAHHTLASGWADAHSVILAGPSPTAGPGGGHLPDVKVDNTAPGASAFTTIVGALMFYGLLAGLAGLILGAIAFGLGKYLGNHHASTGGRVGMFASMAATVVVGGGSALINWAFNLGASI
ncbi:DUF6112 family protein [Kitasatospora sp. NPDC059648]|uniref:DUF6112 family protein n=1 Tax=Kitasatospora sp. NPDC059648 TaxID=3346894 RepID=UPI00367D948D